MKAHGFRVKQDKDRGMISIYPENGNDGWFRSFTDLLEDELPLKDAERLADEFSAKATNQIIWNLMD